MKIIVTGGAGFIGSHLARRLLEIGHKVYVVDNFDPFYSKKLKLKNIKDLKNSNNFSLLQIDITNRRKVVSAIRKIMPDVLIHLAAKAGVRNSIADPIAYYHTNIEGTLNLLEAVKDLKIKKFVFGSSSSVYGERSRVPFVESDNIDNPISPYGLTKVSGEKMCKIYSDFYNIPVVCLRFFTVYGPGQRPDLAINKFMRMIKKGLEIPFYGNGSTYRDYTYVTDIVDGVIRSIQVRGKFDVFNLGNSKPVSLKDLIGMIEKTVGVKAKIKKMPTQPGDVGRTYANIAKSKKIIGWQPKVDFLEGLSLMNEWLVKN